MSLYNLQFFGVKAESELNMSMMCGRGADAEQNFSESDRTRSQKNETPSISGGVHGRMRKNAYTPVTWSERLKICCCVIGTQ